MAASDPSRSDTLADAVVRLAATRLALDLVPRHRALRGRVHSVHRAAIAVEVGGTDELVTIAIESVGGLPGAILVGGIRDLRLLGVRRGLAVTPIPDGWAIHDAGVLVDSTAAALWSAALPGDARLDPSPELLRRVDNARQRISIRARPGGLWAVGTGQADDPWLTRARGLLAAVGSAVAGDELASARSACLDLVGLGVGLTPSGDDALVGLLAGLEATGHPLRGALGAAIGHAATGRTTAQAATALRHAAAGRYSERLHDVLRAIGRAQTAQPGLETAIDTALAFGATSGGDTLSGLFAAIDGIARASRVRSLAA